VAVNGCHFKVHATGKVDVVCAGNNEITFTAGTCVIHVPAQTNLGTIEFLTDTLAGGKHHLILDVNIEKIKYKQTDGFLCPFDETKEATDGHIHGAATLEAEDAGTGAKRHLTHDPTAA
jgi:hypothetical protein